MSKTQSSKIIQIASLLGSLLTGKGVYRSEGVIWASEGVTRKSQSMTTKTWRWGERVTASLVQNFWCTFSLTNFQIKKYQNELRFNEVIQ